MSAPLWRWIDTGLRRPAENLALNRALLEARQAREVPSTLRFLRFTPSALVGHHQDPALELDLAYCANRGIAVQRRLTGGGAIYMDESVIGWELYLETRDVGTPEMAAISRRICTAAADALRDLGAAAEFRAPTDVVDAGRKICGTGGAMDGDALLYQGTLLLDFDVEVMLRALSATASRVTPDFVAGARQSVVNLRELVAPLPALDSIEAAFVSAFAREFGARIERGDLGERELARYRAALAEIDDPAWIGLPKARAA
jgi:lipoate-protein ligase A